MPQFRKKPVVIEAFQMSIGERSNYAAWPAWLQDAWQIPMEQEGSVFAISHSLQIRTLEGVHTVSTDDWIIKGVKGELYPCKPDIFAATYDPVPA